MIHLNSRFLCRKICCMFQRILLCNQNVFDLSSSYPFNPKTLAGFFVAFILQCIVLWHILMYSTILVSFGINSYLFGIASTKFLVCALHQTNESVKSGTNRLAAVSHLNNFIELQSAAKQLSFFFQCVIFIHRFSLIKFMYIIDVQVVATVLGLVSTNNCASIYMVHW